MADIKSHTQRTHFHHPLVIVSWIAPILGIFRVGAGLDAFDPPISAMILSPASEETSKAPEWPADSFDFRRNLVESNGSRPGTSDPRFLGREERLQRVKESAQEFLDRSSIRQFDFREGVPAIVANDESRLSIHR
jgi:hypothetical protein